MFSRRVRDGTTDPMFKTTVGLTANSVASATVKGADTLRWCNDYGNMIEMADKIFITISGDQDHELRQGIIEDVFETLYRKDYIYLRRHFTGKVRHVIKTRSNVSSTSRKKALLQWDDIIALLDRIKR